MAKQLSDTIRDKIVKAREKDKKTITLTDEEACDIWSSLTRVETEIHKLKAAIFGEVKRRFSCIERSLRDSKAKMKEAERKRK